MPGTSPRPPRVAVLADSDTRWKWGALTARLLVPGGEPDGYLLRGRATPTARQLAATGAAPAAPAREVTLAGLVDALATGARDEGATPPAAGRLPEGGRLPAPDVLILACVGHTVQAALHALAHRWPATARRPVIATGYPGVVYEKLTEGLLLRHGADLLLAGGEYDATRFRDVLRGVGADDSAVTVAPLPFLDGARHDPDAVARGDRPYRVVLATQPSVPVSRGERQYLLRRAVAHALRHPEREVVVKLRSAPGEHTTHLEEIPYQRLAARSGPLPANLRLVGGPMGELLDATDLLVTVSSTAALEALARAVPTAILTDLGVREPLGNHWFAGSGCYASWDQLDAGVLPEPHTEWLAARGVHPRPPGAPGARNGVDAAYQPVRERLAALVARAADGELPALAPHYSPRRAPGYLPPLLARHGLDPAGAPLPGRATPAGGAAPGPVRRLVHRTARRAYRAGTQRVAPAIRRWGQL